MQTELVSLGVSAAMDQPSASIESDYLRFFRQTLLNLVYNPHDGSIDGRRWPPGANAISMAGQRRLDSFSALVATAVEDRVPGHIIETGVWRGGASFMAAKTLELLGPIAAGRRVYMADSYKGIPPKTGAYAGHRFRSSHEGRRLWGWRTRRCTDSWFRRCPPPPPSPTLDIDAVASQLEVLNNNSVERVKDSAHRLDLNFDRLRFVVGYFNESLPKMIKDEPDLQFAVIRLDGDTFDSTYEALQILYPRLAPGGFAIIDDYVDWQTCREAVNLYRLRNRIEEPIIVVPHMRSKGEMERGAYWRKQPTPKQALCALNTGLRPKGWLADHIKLSKPMPLMEANLKALVTKNDMDRREPVHRCHVQRQGNI
jgi:hypothetical protein